jgi:tRNA-dihydrouridine synthase
MDFRLCLAPLRGVTDAVFRDAYAQYFEGIDRAISPFLTTGKGPRIKPSQLKEVLPENNTRMPVIPQIISKTADRFITLADGLFQLGYDTVNWNLGCPYPMVAKKKRGSGLLPHPEAIEAFLGRVVPNLRGRLSVKMRLGRHHNKEIETLLPIMNRFDLAEIIIHPRTGVQMYTGEPDLDMFEKCLTLTHHRVIYNGDIVDLSSFGKLQERFGTIDEWMIGRGAVVNPFLPAMIKGHRYDQDHAFTRFKSFHDTLYRRYSEKLYGPSHIVNRMKGMWGYFAKAFSNGDNIRKMINKSQKIHQYESAVDHFFQAPARWRAGILEDGRTRRTHV